MQFMDQLNRAFGDGVRASALRDVQSGRLSGGGTAGIAARALSILIVLTPFSLLALSALLFWLALWSAWFLLWGGLILSAALYLWPRRTRNTLPTLTRADAPGLFNLLDQMCDILGAPGIDGVHVTPDFNAYLAVYGKNERIVGIGGALWICLTPPQRLALLAHEVAHLANNDPARMHVTGRAMQTLAAWHDLFSPPAMIDSSTNTAYVSDGRSLFGQVVGAVFCAAVETLGWTLERLIFAQSQRAEYFADAQASTVAGVAAIRSLLHTLILAPLAFNALRDHHFDGASKVQVFELMAEALRAASPDQIAHHRAMAMGELISIDSTHPPFRFRIDLLDALGERPSSLSVKTIPWRQIENELANPIAAADRKLLDRLVVQ
ncbi:hypothetical protein A8B78_01330 [Jannaschia sp. EhC01]|nr:hypothetical protein A8B78_01330 [Jannaschia sp. EhC01]